MAEHLYIVTYDISDPKRWRRVYRLMHGYGEWLQYSVFQCRLNARRRAQLQALLDEAIHHREDHVIIIDLGVADNVVHRLVSLGKTVDIVTREPVIV